MNRGFLVILMSLSMFAVNGCAEDTNESLNEAKSSELDSTSKEDIEATQEVDASETTDSSAKEEQYDLQEIDDYMSDMDKLMEGYLEQVEYLTNILTSAQEVPLMISKDEWTSRVSDKYEDIKATEESLESINPPEIFQETHEMIGGAIDILLQSETSFLKGVMAGKEKFGGGVEHINESLEIIGESNDKLNEIVPKITEIREELEAK